MPRRPDVLRRLLGAACLAAATACAPGTPPAAPAPAPAPDTVVIVIPEPVVPSDTAPPPPPPRLTGAVRFAFTGDINLGTTTLPDGVPPREGRGLLDAVAPVLVGDLVVGNLEGVLADTGTSWKCLGPPKRPGGEPTPRRNCYAFRTPTALAPRLAEAGFTHLNLANNHAHDYGMAGRLSTEETLHRLGLETYGPIGQIGIDTVARGDSLTVVGLVGFTTYPHSYNLLDDSASAAVVDSVRRMVDVVVVTFHGGAEGSAATHTGIGPEFLGNEPRGDLRRWSRAMIDAGADAVIGHGPHVLRGVEFYRGKPVVYSLGNFATYRGFSIAGPLGVTGVLQLELGGDGEFRSARLVPFVQRARQGPRTDDARTAIALMRRLSVEDFGASAARITEGGAILPPEADASAMTP